MFPRNANGRVTYFDNLKFFLILTVVIGHAAEYYTRTSTMMRDIYLFIYTFHMPLFIFISGYFCKKMINKNHFKLDKPISYLLLYFLMKMGDYLSNRYILMNKGFKLNFFTESAPPWFLLAMVMWICLTYLIKDVKKKYILSASIIISLIIGYDINVRDFLCLSRVIVFFPIFVSGYYINEETLVKILKKKYLKIFSIVFMFTFAGLLLLKGNLVYQFRGYLSGRNPYAVFNVWHPELGAIYRLLFYLLIIIMSLAVLYLIPKKHLPGITTMGTRTLQVYILHTWILKFANHFGWVTSIQTTFPSTWKYLYLLMSVLLTFLLSCKIFEYPFKKILQIRLDKIYD